MLRAIKRKGFTLVELLIVIVVIGILAAGMVIAASEMEATAKATKIINDLRMLNTAAQHWYIDNSLNIYLTTNDGYHIKINNKDYKIHDALQSDGYGIKTYISNNAFALNTGKKNVWSTMYAAVGGYSVYVGFDNTVCYAVYRISDDDKKRDYGRLREKLKGKAKSTGLVYYTYNNSAANKKETVYNGENFVCMRSFVLDDAKLITK